VGESGRMVPVSLLSRRRFLSLTAGAISATALAACTASRQASTASTSARKNTVTLTQWYHAYGEAGTHQAVDRYAKAYDGATVNVQWTPGDYDKLLDDALHGPGAPDVFEAPNGPTIDQIRAGEVLALDDVIGDASGDFSKRLLERMTYRGKLYAVPQVMDVQLLVYRRSMLAKAGIKPPRTFEQLSAAASELTSKNTKGLFVGNDGGVGVLAGPMLWSVGSDYLTSAGRPGFDLANVAVAIARLRELFASGALLLDAPADWSDPTPFANGLAAMQWTGLWTFPELQEAIGEDFGVLPWPRFGAGTGAPSVPIGAYGAAVSARTKNPEAAKAYLKWLWVDETDKQVDFAQSYGFHIPARASLAGQAEKLKTGAAADAVELVTRYGRAQSPLVWTPASNAALSAALTAVIAHGADPMTALRQAKAVVDTELKRIAG
jgi:multiple sugar transport system substrate-binding protein